MFNWRRGYQIRRDDGSGNEGREFRPGPIRSSLVAKCGLAYLGVNARWVSSSQRPHKERRRGWCRLRSHLIANRTASSAFPAELRVSTSDFEGILPVYLGVSSFFLSRARNDAVWESAYPRSSSTDTGQWIQYRGPIERLKARILAYIWSHSRLGWAQNPPPSPFASRLSHVPSTQCQVIPVSSWEAMSSFTYCVILRGCIF